MSETRCPIQWDAPLTKVGVPALVAKELERSYDLRSKELVEDQEQAEDVATPAAVWLWQNKENPQKWLVALRTGGSGRGRGKVIAHALVFSTAGLVEVVEKFQTLSLVVA